MAATALRREEGIGLALAILAHAGLVVLIVARPPSHPLVPPPERITVTLSEDVGLISTSPDPQAAAAPDIAPDLGEPAPPEPEVLPPPPRPEPPKPVPPPPKPVLPKPTPPKPVARPVAKPAPMPVPKPRTVPAPQPSARPSPPPRAAPSPAARPAAKPAITPRTSPTATATPNTRPQARPGASRIGNDFLKGTPNAPATGQATTPPAAVAGPAVKSALAGAISRELKQHWLAPQGAEAEKLVTILSWNLNQDGSLAGYPVVVRQEGITDANRPQAARHAEQATRAVQLAAPFNLPPEHFAIWKRVTSFRFDKRLSQ